MSELIEYMSRNMKLLRDIIGILTNGANEFINEYHVGSNIEFDEKENRVSSLQLINQFYFTYTKLIDKIINIINSETSIRRKKTKIQKLLKNKSRKKNGRELIKRLKKYDAPVDTILEFNDVENKFNTIMVDLANVIPKKKKYKHRNIEHKIINSINIDNRLLQNLNIAQQEYNKLDKYQNKLKGVIKAQENLRILIEHDDYYIDKKYIVRNDKYNNKIRELDEKIFTIKENIRIAQKLYKNASKSRLNTKRYFLQLYINNPNIPSIILSYNTT